MIEWCQQNLNCQVYNAKRTGNSRRSCTLYVRALAAAVMVWREKQWSRWQRCTCSLPQNPKHLSIKKGTMRVIGLVIESRLGLWSPQQLPSVPGEKLRNRWQSCQSQHSASNMLIIMSWGRTGMTPDIPNQANIHQNSVMHPPTSAKTGRLALKYRAGFQ